MLLVSIRNSRRGLATFVAMEEESLAILAVTGHHAVNVALRTAQSEGGPVFIGIGVIHQSLYYFVFFNSSIESSTFLIMISSYLTTS